MINYLLMFICAFIFGSGLIISNMVDPLKIINFLDLTGNWDPSLLFVMLSAVLVTAIGYYFTLRRAKPLCAEKFKLPQYKTIDLKLIVGAAVFGIGWGMAGYCPGPAFTALGIIHLDALPFVVSFMVTSFLLGLIFD